MKKALCYALFAILMLLMLTACGGAAPTAAPTPAPTEEPTAAPPAPSLSSVLPGSDLQSAAPTAPAESAPAVDEAMLEAARACIEQDVDALYDAIGEPSGSSYASSCIGPGEDGELYYEGFTVATYREGEREIVRDVNLNVG
ncbi:MAG: hypothetical protein IJP64_03565 [Oscillospiraceae bacterium]|nr:hypothetical protein [Oscillospiraceae bacterium]